MESNTKEKEYDLFNELYSYISKKRTLIKKILDSLPDYKEFTFTDSNSRDNAFGDCRHHSGINIKSQKGNTYFIGFTGLNIDEKTGNIHSSVGRIQLFIGNGNPNIRHKVDKQYWCINYPNKQSTNIRIDKDISGPVLNTGYKLFGNTACEDILLTEVNVQDFCNLIIGYITKYENIKM